MKRDSQRSRLTSLLQIGARRRFIYGGAVSGLFLAAALIGLGAALLIDGGAAGPPAPVTGVVDLGERPELLDPPGTDRAPAPGPGAAAGTLSSPLGSGPYNVVISRLGVDAPVQTFGIDPATAGEAVMQPQVPVGPGAGGVVAWYDFSARPGAGGNAIFAGHVSWSRVPGAFYYLSTLLPGDVIRLKGGDGTELGYRVFSVFEVDPKDPDSRRVMEATEDDVITLITCGGEYTRTNDPLFPVEYSRRVVVRASFYSISWVGT